jgi:hypothetical protein
MRYHRPKLSILICVYLVNRFCLHSGRNTKSRPLNQRFFERVCFDIVAKVYPTHIVTDFRTHKYPYMKEILPCSTFK